MVLCSQLYTPKIHTYSYQPYRNNNSNNVVYSSLDMLVHSWKFEHLHASATISAIGYTLDLYIYKHVEGEMLEQLSRFLNYYVHS